VSSLVLLLAVSLVLLVSLPSSSSSSFSLYSPPPSPPRRCIHSSVPSLHTRPSCSLACRSLLSLYPLPSSSSACHSLSSSPSSSSACRSLLLLLGVSLLVVVSLPPFLLLYPHPPPHRVISLPRRGFDASHMLSTGRIRWVREVGAGSYVLGLTLTRRALWLSNLSRGCRICRADVGPVSSSSNPSLRRRIRPFVVESVSSSSNPSR
jgi:hypothetical protein